MIEVATVVRERQRKVELLSELEMVERLLFEAAIALC